MHGLDMTESQDFVPGASRAQLEQHGLARGGGDELLFSRETNLTGRLVTLARKIAIGSNG